MVGMFQLFDSYIPNVFPASGSGSSGREESNSELLSCDCDLGEKNMKIQLTERSCG